MREDTTEVIVGAGVLAAALFFAAYTASATGLIGRSDALNLTASFRSVEGIELGSDVRMAGVSIGRVSDISLNAETYRADTSLSLSATIPIPDDSSAVIASEGLLGGNYVEIVPGGSLTNLATGAEIVDTQGSVSLLQLLLTYVGGGEGE